MLKKFILPMLALSLFACETGKEETAESEPVQQEEIIPEPEPEFLYGMNIEEFKIDSGMVQQNQGLAHILPNYGVSQTTIYNVAEQFDSIFDVRKIKPDHKFYMFCELDSNNTPRCFIYEKNAIEYVVFNFKDSLNVSIGQKEVTVVENEAGGVITSSLWNAFVDQDLSPALVMEVAKLYAWTIDFFGLKEGDFFKVIYEQKYVEGQSVGIGDIKAVLFNHMDKDYYTFKYSVDSSDFGYYTEDGMSIKKALLSAPLEFTRISSKFSNNRFHPVLKIYRPHHGVDYAAPTGTDVVATGDGVITFAGRAGGAGNLVKIKHTVGNILTKYMHLSKFGPGIKKGVHVMQGQKIGEVGSTGVSTGPHLDYRIFINGKAVNPLSVDIPTADPIVDSLKQPFLDFINPLKLRLDSIEAVEIQIEEEPQDSIN